MYLLNFVIAFGFTSFAALFLVRLDNRALVPAQSEARTECSEAAA
jgi:hypothetical protein